MNLTLLITAWYFISNNCCRTGCIFPGVGVNVSHRLASGYFFSKSLNKRPDTFEVLGLLPCGNELKKKDIYF